MARTMDAIEYIKPCLFLNEENLPYSLSNKDLESKKRIEAIFAYALEHPQDADSKIVEFLKRTFKIEKSQAYWDINATRLILGNVKNAGKEWHRYVVNQTCLEAMTMAKKKKNPIAMTMAADKYGKYNNLDKEDIEQIDWTKVNGFEIEITSDPKILNIKQPKDIEAVRKRLVRELMSDIEDADIL